MPLFRLILILFFSFSFFNIQAQTQEDFTAKMTEVYTAGGDQKKAMKAAMELYQMTEKSKELQTYVNYYVLNTIFSTPAPDEKLATICKEKAEKLLKEITGTVRTVNVSQDVSSKWYNEIFPDLFKTIHKDNADKAVAFLTANPALQNYSNYSYIAYAFERNGDFSNAKKYYEHALTLEADPKTEYLPLNFYTNFLSRSGDYMKAGEYILKMDKLSMEAMDIYKTSYKSCALTSKTIYFMAIGDYQSFIQASDDQYDYYENLPSFKSDKNACDAFSQSRFTMDAFANEMLKHYDLAEKEWYKRDSAHYVWVACFNKMVVDSNKTYPLSMLPVYLSKRGKQTSLKNSSAFYAKEAETHFNSYKDYSDISINFMKGSHFGFLRSPKYHETFVPILKQIKESKNFQESTMPFTHYAYFNMRDKRFTQANENYVQLFELNNGWINDLIFSLGEKAFVTYYNGKLREGYDNFHSFVRIVKDKKTDLFPGLSGQAYNNLLFTKALSLKGVQKRKKAFLDNNDPYVKVLYDKWLDKKQELIRHYHRSDNAMDSIGRINEQQVKNLQEEVSHLENELTIKGKDFQKYLKLETPGWKEVQAKLKEGEAAVEMVRFLWRDQTYYSDSAYYAAYIITKNSLFPEVVYLPDFAEDLDHKHYGFYKNNIRLKLSDKESYNHYWKPVMDKLKGIKRVYFSPDGIYHIINLNTLQNPETGKFLLEELEIRYTTSTSDLLSYSAPKGVQKAVLIGRPSYKIENFDSKSMLAAADNTRGFVRDFRGNNISDLPGTEDEVLSIKKQMETSGVTVSCYLRQQATEEAVYKIRSPDILHIATHGYWSDAGPDATEGYRVFNAMVNSGLLLSGVVNYYTADKTPDSYDGILTAYEAQNLSLENTSLVILSACETSLGHFDAGEGVYGLQRAFRAAGARSVMTSLWKVDDNATRDFMIFFYKNFLLTKDKYAAFAEAQRSLMQKYPEPYYWGAFILSGI
jgi:CHAT domain-containing protein